MIGHVVAEVVFVHSVYENWGLTEAAGEGCGVCFIGNACVGEWVQGYCFGFDVGELLESGSRCSCQEQQTEDYYGVRGRLHSQRRLDYITFLSNEFLRNINMRVGTACMIGTSYKTRIKSISSFLLFIMPKIFELEY